MPLCIPKDSSQRIMSAPTGPEVTRSTKKTGSEFPPKEENVQKHYERGKKKVKVLLKMCRCNSFRSRRKVDGGGGGGEFL